MSSTINAVHLSVCLSVAFKQNSHMSCYAETPGITLSMGQSQQSRTETATSFPEKEPRRFGGVTRRLKHSCNYLIYSFQTNLFGHEGLSGYAFGLGQRA